jgi:hypothetical protein
LARLDDGGYSCVGGAHEPGYYRSTFGTPHRM